MYRAKMGMRRNDRDELKTFFLIVPSCRARGFFAGRRSRLPSKKLVSRGERGTRGERRGEIVVANI